MLLARCLALACLLSGLALATPCRADDVAAAKTLFNQGLAAMQAGRHETGCPAIEASYKLDPRPGTLFTLAECEAQRGRLATAVARYDDYLSMFARLPAEQRKRQGDRDKIARDQRAALEPQVPSLRLLLPPNAPPGTVVKRDGQVVERVTLGVALPIDPGDHLITAQVPGGDVIEQQFTVDKGAQLELTVKLTTPLRAPVTLELEPEPAPEPPSPPPEPAETGPSGRRIGAFVTLGLGVTGLVAGGVLGGLTLREKSTIVAFCNVDGIPAQCLHEGYTAAQRAQTFGLFSTVGFGVGIAGLGTAAVLFLTEPKRPRSAAAGGRGISVEVLSVGPEGAVIGLRGGF